jgi:drug/metabolite transporter (DMT)-like permease
MVSFLVIKKFGATASGMAGFIVTVVASIEGVLLLDEQITASMVAGMVLIIIGITIINQKSTKETNSVDPGCI